MTFILSVISAIVAIIIFTLGILLQGLLVMFATKTILEVCIACARDGRKGIKQFVGVGALIFCAMLITLFLLSC